MKYEQVSLNAATGYPNHDIDPALKGKDWCMQYAKASYFDYNFVYPKGVFSTNGGQYEQNRMYALGKQLTTQYKKQMGVNMTNNHTWLSVDWKIRAIVSGYRDKAIARMMKNDYQIVATPVDILAKGEHDKNYIELKAKLAVRAVMLQTNPELANHPLIAMQSGEPMDVEELEMRMALGEQFNRAKDAEMAIELGFYENDHDGYRKSVFEDLFDYGVAGFAEYLGDDNRAKFRRVDPNNVIISYSKKADFSDIVHAGEQIDVSLIELGTLKDAEGNALFTTDELNEFASTIAGKFGNPRLLGATNSNLLKQYDKFKCPVFDIKFYTYNTDTYTNRVDANGNIVFKKEKYGRGQDTNTRYHRKRIQYVYQCKWIVGTDKCYDWGMCYDQVRSTNTEKKAYTTLPYKFISYNFYEMRAQSFMDRLIPYVDEYQLTILKIQNFKNRAVPSGWWIDYDALIGVSFNKGGKNMTPQELLQMFMDTGVLLGSSVDNAGNPKHQNWKAVVPIENTAASELAMFYQDLLNIVSTIEKMTGYNDITSGNPNPKTLVPGYQIAEQSTNDALFPMVFAERQLNVRLAEAVLARMQQGIRKGKITGYAPYKGALGVNTLRFIALDGALASREYGIELQEKTTDDQKMWLLQQMQQDIQNGWLDTSDAVILVNTMNSKEAQAVWALKVRKAKEKAQADKLAQLQEQNKGAIESATIAQQAAQQVLQMELQAKIQMQQDLLAAEIEKVRMKIESEERIAMQNNSTKVLVAQDTADGKIQSTDIAGVHSQIKQQIANQKQTSSTK